MAFNFSRAVAPKYNTPVFLYFGLLILVGIFNIAMGYNIIDFNETADLSIGSFILLSGIAIIGISVYNIYTNYNEYQIIYKAYEANNEAHDALEASYSHLMFGGWTTNYTLKANNEKR